MIKDSCTHKTKWIITRYPDEKAFRNGTPMPVIDANGRVLPAVSVIESNILLNVGIGEMWDLICSLGSPTAYSNANAQVGVGDSSTAEDASQTDLQGTNKAWVGMSAGYPQRSGTTVTFRGEFDGSTGNFDWREFAVRNGATANKLMNRKVDNQGTKVSGQVWTLDLQITLS